MGIIKKIADGLRKTKDFLFGGIQRILNSFTEIDDELFDQLEEQMIMSDIGVETSEEICDQLRKKIKERGITDPQEIMELIHEVVSEMMGDDTGLDLRYYKGMRSDDRIPFLVCAPDGAYGILISADRQEEG